METIMTLANDFKVVRKEVPVSANTTHTSIFAGKPPKKEMRYHLYFKDEYVMTVNYSKKKHIFENNVKHAIESAIKMHRISLS